jgi:molybdopterin-guanine dinucleotide biosynthesis protein B
MNIYGVTGWKNTGKTGLMERLVAEMVARGLTVSTVKHAHHDTEIDHPGRDSYRHRAAGAREVVLSSPRRWAVMHELRDQPEPMLAELLTRLSPVDLVLIEGYKRADHPKIEAYRAETRRDLLARDNPTIRAVASDVALEGLAQPVLHLDDTSAIADFILRDLSLQA